MESPLMEEAEFVLNKVESVAVKVLAVLERVEEDAPVRKESGPV